MKKVILLLILCGFLFLISIYPFLTLLKKITFLPTGFSLKYFSNLFENQLTLLALKNTIIISLGVALLSTLIALPLSWILSRSELKGASKWRSAFSLPYAIPPYIGAIAWITLTNPSNGLLNQLFGKGFFNIYSHSGLIWVMSSFFYTFILLSLLTSLDRIDSSMEEAAKLSGASDFKIFKDITLPLILPSLLSGIILVILATAASFGVPALIGSPGNIFLTTTQIYTLQKMGSLNGIYSASSLSIFLLFIAIILLILNQKVINKNYFSTVSGKSTRPTKFSLGKAELPLQIFLGFLFFVIFVMPILGISLTAFSKVQGIISFDNLGLQNFKKIFFEFDETPRAFLNSTYFAFITATIACFFGLFLAYIQQKTKIKGRGLINIFVSLPYATPGTVLALAFILTFSAGFSIWGFRISLYNTSFLIIMAYLAKYLNFSTRMNADSLEQVDDSLIEAARLSGASPFKIGTSIWIPLLKPALVASWFLVFMPAFSELTMTILLTGPGLETLGTFLFQLQEYADTGGGGSAVIALLIICMVMGSNAIVKISSKGKYGL